MAQRTPFDPYLHLRRLKLRKKPQNQLIDPAMLILLIITMFVLGYACGRIGLTL